MVKEIKLFTGEVLKLNAHGVWEIYSSEDSLHGYPVDLVDLIVNIDKFVTEKFYKEV